MRFALYGNHLGLAKNLALTVLEFPSSELGTMRTTSVLKSTGKMQLYGNVANFYTRLASAETHEAHPTRMSPPFHLQGKT